jgi:hypothetical protein
MTHSDSIPDDNPVLQAALAYVVAGRSVAPIFPNQKYPQGNGWKVYQTRLATIDEIKSWFLDSPLLGLCLICGQVSGGLENLDFDDFQTYDAYVALVCELGYDHLLERLVIEQTPRPGLHLGYCCEVIAGNQKLARQKIGLRSNGRDDIKTLIETRGEGGLIVCYPTPPGIHPDHPERGYDLIQGDWTCPPLITPDEREILWNCARALNRYDKGTTRSHDEPKSEKDRIGSDYNERVTHEELLQLLHDDGWTRTYRDTRGDYLLRPGKSGRGWSATLGICAPKRLYVFSTNADPFDNDRSYDPFGIYMRLKHAGDAKAAAKALAELGYGRNGHPGGERHTAEERDEGYNDAGEHHKDENDKPIPPYLIKWSLQKGNALYYQKPGTTDEQILANFMAWIVEERLEDDGAESIRMVTLDATLSSGKRFSEIRIAVPEFYSLVGLMKALGTEAVVSPGPMVKDRIRHAIQLYSNRQKYPQRHVFTHLGWRQVNGAWCYLHAGGSIPSAAEVSVDKALQRYTLPQVSTPQRAIEASLRVLACAPQRLTIPLLSMVYLAPLAHWLEPDVTGWLEGPSGARKSSLAALMMSHFGPFSRVHPPDSWESTANTLERLAFLAKDTLLWIDDYAPQPSAKEAHEQERKAQRVVRAQGNLSGRGRMRADTSLRPQYYPRGVILSTGELHPTGTSTFARLLQLDVDKDDIKLDLLTTSQAESHLLAEAMAGYVGWLQPQLETLPPILKARWHELRSQALPHLTHHSRHPEVYAHLAVAWELLLRFAAKSGVFTEEEHLFQWHVGCEALMQAINRQRLDAEAEDPVHRFCSHIREALIQGKAYLDDVRGGYPEDASQWGWTLQTTRHNDGTVSGEWRPSQGASMLGWLDEEFLYLLPNAAYRLVFENLQKAGILQVQQQALWKLLIQRGYIRRGKDHLTDVKKILGRSERVLVLSRIKLEGYLSSETGNSGNLGNNEL